MGNETERLTAIFRKLGAPDPEGWATSQIEEGIPQLARFLFLRQAWRQIVVEGDAAWIDREIKNSQAHPGTPFSGIGAALQRLRGEGVQLEDLTDVVRGMQAQLLFNLCYQLEDPGDLEPEATDVAWALFSVDEDGQPTEQIGGLHESVLETDPTGREMRPRKLPG